MKFYKNCALFLAIALMISVIAIGCAPARRPLTDRPENIAYRTPGRAGTPGAGTGTRMGQGTTPLRPIPATERGNEIATPYGTGDNRLQQGLENDRNARLETAVQGVPGVNNAVVLTNNNVAYVAVDMGRATTDARVNDVRDEITRRITEVEPSITRVYVSANPDVFGRVQGYGRELRAGRPITGFMTEIEEMFTRALPRTR